MKKLLLVSLIFSLSCSRSSKSSLTVKFLNSLGDTAQGFVKDIPIEKEGYYRGKVDLMYVFTTADARGMKLDSLTGGYDAFKMRIWLGHSLARITHIITIWDSASEWHARIVTYTKKDEVVDSVKGWIAVSNVIVSDKIAYPVDGWDYLLEKILALHITTLPNSNDIKGYERDPGADGIQYFFETATAKKYRFYYYCEPEDMKSKFWQAKNVLEFSEILENEFGFTYTR